MAVFSEHKNARKRETYNTVQQIIVYLKSVKIFKQQYQNYILMCTQPLAAE